MWMVQGHTVICLMCRFRLRPISRSIGRSSGAGGAASTRRGEGEGEPQVNADPSLRSCSPLGSPGGGRFVLASRETAFGRISILWECPDCHEVTWFAVKRPEDESLITVRCICESCGLVGGVGVSANPIDAVCKSLEVIDLESNPSSSEGI